MLTKFIQDIKLDFNHQKGIFTVFIDFKGAYDTVWRAKLISKLKIYGVRGCMLSWYTGYLTPETGKDTVERRKIELQTI